MGQTRSEITAPQDPSGRLGFVAREGVFRPEGSIKGSIPTASCRPRKFSRTEKPCCAGLLQSPLTDSNRRPPPYHTQATGRNPRQRFSPVSAVFGAAPFASGCHRLQPRGSIKAPFFVVSFGYLLPRRVALRVRFTARRHRRLATANESAGVPACRVPPIVPRPREDVDDGRTFLAARERLR
jgi:hypothetical protein